MSTTSRAVAVRTALKTLLAANVDADATVYYSPPTAQDMPNDAMFNGEIRSGSHEIPVQKAGRKKREESFVTEIIMYAVRAGADATDAETRAFVLLGVLEDVLADDVSLGLSATDPTLRAHLEDFDATTEPHGVQWRCQIVAGVRVETRLA